MIRAKIEKRLNKKPSEIAEVFTTEDATEANRRLASGWSLLYGGVSHVDNLGYNVKPIFVLCRDRK